ncbi:MAG: hypothetical protein JWL84_671, partial [Rhodospirillales bacterium]|nr:hypothetical protein [Rhodospirillales bacterium]
NPLKIDVTTQGELVLWIAMKTAAWEFTDRPTVSISQADRTWIWEKREPPPDWRIWIGRYVGTEWRTRYRHHGMALARSPAKVDRPPGHNTQVTTLVAGELLIHVCSSSLPGIIDQMGFRGYSATLLHQLWPATRRAIRWPNGPTSDDEDVSVIADAFWTAVVKIPRGVLTEWRTRTCVMFDSRSVKYITPDEKEQNRIIDSTRPSRLQASPEAAVMASNTKPSSLCGRLLDRHVASLLAMTV